MEWKYYLRGLGLGIAMTAVIMGVALSGRKRPMTDEEIIARAKELGMVENTVLADMDDGDAGDSADDGVKNTEDKKDIEQEQAEEENTLDIPVSDDTGSVPQPAPETGTEETDGNENDTADGAAGTTDAKKDATDSLEDEEQDEIATVANNVRPDAAQSGRESGQPKQDEQPQQNVNEIITSAAVKTITINSGDGSYTVARKLADVGVVISAETFDTYLCENGYDKRLRTGTFSIPADASDEQIARIVTGAE